MKSIKEIKILYPSKRVIFEIIFCIAIPIFFASCSKNLLKRSDYRSSVSSLKAGDPAAALRFFPSGESNTFIPIMEKTYLNLLQGKPEIDELQKYSTRIENRLKYKVSRELKYLAYVETPEGYFASEHEIIWMHMLLSWGYSLRNDFDSAAIEAKKAAVILEGKSREGRFDDPMIRIILGVLWAMCDRWEDARVDFRVAAMLDPALRWAAAFANMERPPEHLSLLLAGTGPEPYWDPKLKWNPVRGLRDMNFVAPAVNRNIYAVDSRGRHLPVYTTPNSNNWYIRHLMRDNAIHEIIGDSRYGQRVIYSTTKGTVKATAGITGGILVGILSIAVGGLVVYAGVYANSGEAVLGGFGIMIWGVDKGYEIARKSVKSSVAEAKKEMDVSDAYRFVRFLPNQAFVIYGKGEHPIRVRSGQHNIEMNTDINNSSKISIRYLPPKS